MMMDDGWMMLKSKSKNSKKEKKRISDHKH